MEPRRPDDGNPASKEERRAHAGLRGLDDAFVKINGQLWYLLRAVNHEREVLESVVSREGSRHVLVLKVLKRTMKTYGSPQNVRPP